MKRISKGKIILTISIIILISLAIIFIILWNHSYVPLAIEEPSIIVRVVKVEENYLGVMIVVPELMEKDYGISKGDAVYIVIPEKCEEEFNVGDDVKCTFEPAVFPLQKIESDPPVIINVKEMSILYNMPWEIDVPDDVINIFYDE